MKKYAILLLLGSALLFQARGEDGTSAADVLKQADAARTAAKYDEALGLYEQVITQHPEAAAQWYTAQTGITQVLIKKGDLAGAAKSAHLCLDGAPLATYDNVVGQIAGILSVQDNDIERANQFIAFQQSGSGTNPLDAVGYPSLPQREAAFAAIRQQAGEDAAASRLRAQTYLFTGHPKDALAQFADAFRRSDLAGLPQVTPDLIGIGLRNVHGHRVGLDGAAQFVVWGPVGPDGKPGTADDLADPFTAFLPPATATGDGGLAGFSPAALATLHQVRDAARLYSGDPFVPAEIRHSAIVALHRVSLVLVDWGSPGQKDWFVNLALPVGAPFPDPQTRQLLLHDTELAARGSDLHLGGVHQLWREITPKITAQGLQDDKPIQEPQTQLDKVSTSIGAMKFPKSNLKPLTAPARL